MARLGSHKRPAVVRVQSSERAAEITAICDEHGWKVIAGIEPDVPEDTSDVDRLLAPLHQAARDPKVGRNDPCPCGSGKKFKKCCLGRPATPTE